MSTHSSEFTNGSEDVDKAPEIDEMDAEGSPRISFTADDESSYEDTQELVPLSSGNEKEKIPGIGICRRAMHTDISSILKLFTEQTTTFFGKNIGLGRLIEHAYMSLSLCNENDDLIAFMSLRGYPNLILPPASWEDWISRKFNFRTALANNTLFIHLIVWDETYYPECIDQLFFHAYIENCYLEHIVITTPPFSEPFTLLDGFFKMVERPHEQRPLRTQNVYVNKRQKYVRKIYVRNFCNDDSYDITNLVKCFDKKLISIYGENLVFDIFEAFKEEKIGFVGQGESLKDIGFVLCNININFPQLSNIFDGTLFRSLKNVCEDKTFLDPSLSYTHDILPIRVLEPTNHYDVSMNKSPSFEAVIDQNQEIVDDDELNILSGFCAATMMMIQPKQLEEGMKESTVPKINVDWCQRLIDRYSNQLIKKAVIGKALKHSFAPRADNEENPKAFSIELFFLGPEQDEKSCYDYLIGVFNLMPNYDYCLISLPTHYQLYSLLCHFHRLCPSPRQEFYHDLYITHRLTLFGRITIRYANPSDFEDIVAISRHEKSNKQVQEDAFKSIILRHRGIKTLILLVDGKIFGFTILCQLFEYEFLRAQFNLEDIMYYAYHKGDEHCFVKHMQMTCLFIPKTRFILKEIMRFTGFSSLYAVVFTENTCKKMEMMPLPGLMYWTPVSPRRIPTYSCTLGSNVPFCRVNHTYEPFGLFYMNPRISSMQKMLCSYRIVVVGGGDVTLSFLEHLIFSPTSVYRGYSRIILISKHGFPPGEMAEDVAWVNLRLSMLVHKSRYYHKYLYSLALPAWLTVIKGTMTGINRREKYVLVNEDGAVYYDYLFLFCGQQYVKPLPPPKGIKSIHNCQLEIEKDPDLAYFLQPDPKNMFTINNEFDAEDALFALRTLMPMKKEGEKLLVYGHSLSTLACINCLLWFGVPPSDILHIEPFPSGQFAVEFFNNPVVYDASQIHLRKQGVKTLTPFKFGSWELVKERIVSVHFESHSQVVTLDCIVFFYFGPKRVNPHAFKAVIEAALVYDGLLVIDHNFKTNDPYIYAAGPMTKYARKYYAQNYYHEHYNPVEIGAEVATRFAQLVENESENITEANESGTDSDDDIPTVVEFTWPVIEKCALSGGWNYFRVRRPGPELPLETLLNEQHDLGKIITTGHPLNANGPGYFRILLDQDNFVIDITCYSQRKIHSKNLIKIYGKHEALLNHLVQRYDCGTIVDLYEYFQDPWAYFLYHDRYPLLKDENQLLTATMLLGGSFSLLEFVATKYHQSKWSELPPAEKTLIENLWRSSEIVSKAKQNLLNYFNYNDNLLTMFVTPKRIKELQEDFKFSPLFEDPKKMAGRRYPLLRPNIHKPSRQNTIFNNNDKVEYFHGTY